MKTAVLILVPIYISYIAIIGVVMFLKRYKAIKTREVKLKYFKDYVGESTYELEIFNNHFNNQFQLPLIFLILCVAQGLSDSVSLTTCVLSYVFVICRFFHTFFHLGSNKLVFRAISYVLGALILVVLSFNFFFSVAFS